MLGCNVSTSYSSRSADSVVSEAVKAYTYCMHFIITLGNTSAHPSAFSSQQNTSSQRLHCVQEPQSQMQYTHFLHIIKTLMLWMTSTYAQRPHHDEQMTLRDFPHRLQVCEPEKKKKIIRFSLTVVLLFCFTPVLPLIILVLNQSNIYMSY